MGVVKDIGDVAYFKKVTMTSDQSFQNVLKQLPFFSTLVAASSMSKY